jgi:hypothetical protein
MTTMLANRLNSMPICEVSVGRWGGFRGVYHFTKSDVKVGGGLE